MISSRKNILAVSVVLVALVAAYFITAEYGYDACKLTRAGQTTTVRLSSSPNSSITSEVADTPQLQACGLMFRKNISEADGMIFVFGSEGYWSFWMKNTLIPTDIIWIDSGYKIVDIQTAVPCTSFFCDSYSPSSPAKYVVEVNAGYVERHNVKTGDSVLFSV